MRIGQLCQTLQNRHKTGESYRVLGEAYGISKGMAWQIAHGYKPGKRVSAILGLDPPARLLFTRTRRARLNEIAKKWGFTGWANYETWMLRSN